MTIEETIHIAAEVRDVWAVTVDVVRWPEWTPTVTAVTLLEDAPLQVGSRVRVKQPAQPEAEWVVTDYVAQRFFVWESRRTAFHMRATHEMRAGPQGTTNVLRLEASGALAALMAPVLRPLIRQALKTENAGLKARCEQGPRA